MENYVLNGSPNGPIAEKLMAVNWDIGALRPWIGKDGKSYITVNENGVAKNYQTTNALTTLRKDDWLLVDSAVTKAAGERLRAVQDLRDAGLTFNIPNGMSKTVLETETVSDIRDAEMSMDALHKGASDRPTFEVTNLPLPIIHYDFHYSLRQIQNSRNGGSPLDTTTAELAGRKVGEFAEKLLLGKSTPASYTFGGGTITGYTNFADVLTQVLTDPSTSGWVGATILDEVLTMRQSSMNVFHYGPWMLYNSPTWDQYLDQDYSSAKGDNTVRDRLKKINGITDIRTLDFLTSYEMVLVQMTSNVVREVVGMDITTVQWESQGGFLLNYKVMAILVPQLRSDQANRTGIVYGS